MRPELSVIVLIVLASLTSCALSRAHPQYDVHLPILHAAPLYEPCLLDGMAQSAECVTVLKEDWFAVVTELKAQCIALGHTLKECDAK